MLNCLRKAIPQKNVPTPDFKAIKKSTVFSTTELHNLFDRFCLLSNSEGVMEKIQFLQQPELAFVPLASAIFEIEKKSENTVQGISFNEFVAIANILSPKTGLEAKYKCTFIIS